MERIPLKVIRLVRELIHLPSGPRLHEHGQGADVLLGQNVHRGVPLLVLVVWRYLADGAKSRGCIKTEHSSRAKKI